MLDISGWSVMSLLSSHRRRHDNFSGVTIFPIRNASFLEIENQLGRTPLNVFIQTLDCSVEERSRYLQTLLLLRNTFHLDELLATEKNKQIDPVQSYWTLDLTLAVMFDLLFRNRCVTFGVLFSRVNNLAFTILIKTTIPLSISWALQALPEYQFQRILWVIESSYWRIDESWNLLFDFCDITNISNFRASDFDFFNNHVLAEEFGKGYRDKKFGKVCQENVER
jgi:hypothetical protein